VSIWTVTVVDGRETITTVHPSLADAVASFAQNYDPEGEFPKTLTGVQAAADAQGLRLDITEQAG
jgi:hypothetical protein